MPADPSLESDEERYAELGRLMRAAVGRICPPWLASEKDDLVQKALLRLMRKERDAGGSLEVNATYLHRTAHSLLVDEIRRRRRRRETPLADDEEAPHLAAPSTEAGPERRSYARQLGQALRECLERLIGPRRQAMGLTLLGHPNREIAVLMGWDPKRTENLVTRGRKDLRTCLEEKGFTP